MLGITTPAMVAACADLHILGSLPLGGLTSQAASRLIQETKSLTKNRFAVNLFTYPLPTQHDRASIMPMVEFLSAFSRTHSLGIAKNDFLEVLDTADHPYEDLIDLIIQEKCPVVSFTFGKLKESELSHFRRHGIVTIGTATSLDEASALENLDIDVITLQGGEAGGHRGSFLDSSRLTKIPIDDLIMETRQKIKKPLIAAGGIHDRESIQRVMKLGAAGVQVGSALLASTESAAPPAHKKALTSGPANPPAFTRAFTGRWAKAIINHLPQEIDNARLTIPPYPTQGKLTSLIRSWARKQERPDFMTMLAGDFAYRAKPGSARDIMLDLIGAFAT
jgi:nitronate monooxygenase